MFYKPGAVHQPGDRIHILDHAFTWTDDHLSEADYLKNKQTYDVLAEDCLSILENLPDAEGTTKPDMYARLAAHHASHPTLTKFWEQVNTIPDWVDWEQISRGQDVFYRYGLAMVSGLAYQSLLGGTGGSGKIAETLARTGGFSIKSVRHRLLETTQFTLQVTDSIDSIRPGGAGWVTAVRVRLLHTRVRRKILNLTASHPSYYNVEEFGVPINDADCITTIVAFSPMMIWLALPRQGIYMSQQEMDDYIALWRLVAWIMGTPTDPFATTALAKATMETTLMYEYNPTPLSKTLARNVIRALENQAPEYASRALIEVHTRWMNGNALSDALDIPQPTWYYSALAFGQVAIFASFYNFVRLFPALDKWYRDALKKQLWEAIMSAKTQGLKKLSVFDFKYVPAIDRKVAADEADFVEQKKNVFWTADRKTAAVALIPLTAMLMGLLVLMQTVRVVLALGA